MKIFRTLCNSFLYPLYFPIAGLMVTFAQDVYLIYAGRAITGFCIGIISLSLPVYLGAKYLVFVSSCSVKLRELSFAQFVYFLRKVCLFFNFIIQKLNDEIHNYVLFDIIVNFIIQKLKNKHTLLKKYTN